MNNAAVLEKVEALAKTVQRLQARIEDLEDFRDLEAAVKENGTDPLISWEHVTAEHDMK